MGTRRTCRQREVVRNVLCCLGGVDGTTSCSMPLLNQAFFLVYLVVALRHVILGCNVYCQVQFLSP